MNKICLILSFMTITAVMLFANTARQDREDFALNFEYHVCDGEIVRLALPDDATNEDMEKACRMAGY